QQAFIAVVVLVAHAAVEHVGHGLEAAVGMARETGDVVFGPVGAELVEQQERIQVGQRGAADHAGEPDSGAVGRGGAADLADDAGVLGRHGALLGNRWTGDGAIMRPEQGHGWNTGLPGDWGEGASGRRMAGFMYAPRSRTLTRRCAPPSPAGGRGAVPPARGEGGDGAEGTRRMAGFMCAPRSRKI